MNSESAQISGLILQNWMYWLGLIVSGLIGFYGAYWVFVRNWILESLKEDLRAEQDRLKLIQSICFKQINEVLKFQDEAHEVSETWDFVIRLSIELDEVAHCTVTEIATPSLLSRTTMSRWKRDVKRFNDDVTHEDITNTYLHFLEKIRHLSLMPIRIPRVHKMILDRMYSNPIPKELRNSATPSSLDTRSILQRGAILNCRRWDLIDFSCYAFTSSLPSLCSAYFSNFATPETIISQLLLYTEAYVPLSIPVKGGFCKKITLLGLQKRRVIFPKERAFYRASYIWVDGAGFNVSIEQAFDPQKTLYDDSLNSDSDIRIFDPPERLMNVVNRNTLEFGSEDVEKAFKRKKKKLRLFIKENEKP